MREDSDRQVKALTANHQQQKLSGARDLSKPIGSRKLRLEASVPSYAINLAAATWPISAKGLTVGPRHNSAWSDWNQAGA
ncbi:MAG: hypothetical protein IPO97_10385 [Sphingomonadales bacterium]|nr:hypothetical protein [Sphingomonadales bacterium]